jgi:hypothetical protein
MTHPEYGVLAVSGANPPGGPARRKSLEPPQVRAPLVFARNESLREYALPSARCKDACVSLTSNHHGCDEA